MEQVMLDMIPTGAKAVCHVSQYDIGRTIRFNLRSGGAVYTLSGTETVKVYIKKPDGTTAERNIANTSSTYVDWVTGEGDCDQAGNCECELVITSGTTVIGSKNFTVKIEEDPYNDQGVVTETAGPAVIATFTTNVVDLLQEVKCSINPIQNGTPWIDSNEVNKEPYIKRNVAGTATRIGNHLYDKLVGGTVAWNQLAQTSDVLASKTASGLTITNNLNGSITVTGTASDDNWIRITTYFYPTMSHKCLIDINENNTLKISDGFVSTHGIINFQQSELGLYIRPSANVAYSETLYIVLIDLTQMFGSTIADYIYSLEQATAGAGVAWFKALFPNDYYAYNAGELISVKATAHVMKNASNQVIGNYALDSNLVLNGLFKLDANNKLYADGDTYESIGAVKRRFDFLNLTTANWEYVANYQMWRCTDIASVVKKQSAQSDMVNFIAFPYIIENTAQLNALSVGSLQVGTSGNIWVNNGSDTVQPTGTLLYEKATPTTEQASPFTNPQVCDENGTEEYIDSRTPAIPVGHETYQANICEITGFDELNIQQSGQDTSEIAKLIRLVFDDTVYLAEASCLNGVWKLKLLGAEAVLPEITELSTSSGHKYSVYRPTGINNAASVSNDILSSLLSPRTVLGDYFGYYHIGTNVVICVPDNYTVAEYNAEIAGSKLVYQRATPIEITLDETEQFEALLGVNNVWHDANGDTEVKYLYNA